MSFDKLHHLERRKQQAETKLTEELNRMFPDNSEVKFFISRHQKNPSIGTVICSDRGPLAGHLRIRMLSKKQDVKSVHFMQLLRK